MLSSTLCVARRATWQEFRDSRSITRTDPARSGRNGQNPISPRRANRAPRLPCARHRASHLRWSPAQVAQCANIGAARVVAAKLVRAARDPGLCCSLTPLEICRTHFRTRRICPDCGVAPDAKVSLSHSCGCAACEDAAEKRDLLSLVSAVLRMPKIRQTAW